MSSYDDKIRDYDENGRLIRAGYRWREMVEGIQFFGFTLMLLGGGGLFSAWMLGSIIRPRADNVAPTIAAFSLGMILLGVLFARVLAYRERATIFDADGTIGAPLGLPGYRFHRKVNDHHETIMSIEAKYAGQYTRWIVRLISRGGDTVWFAQNLSEPGALKVAVQLTNALAELRQQASDNTQLTTVGPHPRVEVDDLPTVD